LTEHPLSFSANLFPQSLCLSSTTALARDTTRFFQVNGAASARLHTAHFHSPTVIFTWKICADRRAL